MHTYRVWFKDGYYTLIIARTPKQALTLARKIPDHGPPIRTEDLN